LMWINLFQDTMAALALATDAPSPTILDKKPDPRSAPLITIQMWKMIYGQSAYQVVVTLVLYFRGATILNYHTELEQLQLHTVVFNTYVWMNIFNMYKYVCSLTPFPRVKQNKLTNGFSITNFYSNSNRRIDNKFNILEGVWRNYLFITITTIMIGAQVLIIFIGGETFSVTRLHGGQWALSVVLGFLCIPFGFIMRLISDEFLGKQVRAVEGPSKALVRSIRRWTGRPSTVV
jgi:Ca2+-transporting ATPase